MFDKKHMNCTVYVNGIQELLTHTYIIKSKSNIFIYFNDYLLPSSQIYIFLAVYIYSQHENIITAVVNWNTTSQDNARKC